jgi:hypothetical protein
MMTMLMIMMMRRTDSKVRRKPVRFAVLSLLVLSPHDSVPNLHTRLLRSFREVVSFDSVAVVVGVESVAAPYRSLNKKVVVYHGWSHVDPFH